MLALRFDGQLDLADLPKPTPKLGEALVRVTVAGICNTDLEIVKGYMGFRGVLGHEFAGIVEEAANEHLIGKRVVGEINCVCGNCVYCQKELPHHCLNRTVLGILGRDGAFAEYIALPEANLHIVPHALSDDAAVFTEPTAAAFRIAEQVAIDPGDRIIVLGDGKLGQLISQVLWLRSKRVLCVGKHREKLRLLERLGIPIALSTEPIEAGADVVVEATGSEAGLTRALTLVRPEGKLVLKTTVSGATTVNLALPVINEVTIVGSRCGPFKPALEALSLGNVEVHPLISETFPLLDGLAAFRRAAEPGVLKVLLKMPTA
jgi:threonine dehydrogenase-like Zn-dependent dehydrogenase